MLKTTVAIMFIQRSAAKRCQFILRSLEVIIQICCSLILIYLLCRAAAQRWDGEGALLFTSSSGVYDVHDNGFCDEVGLFHAYLFFVNYGVLCFYVQPTVCSRCFRSISLPDEDPLLTGFPEF